MQKPLLIQAANASVLVSKFMAPAQLQALRVGCDGEEGTYFMEKLIEFGERVSTMPVTYDQDGKGDDAIAYLHYFDGGSDWYITEKDVDGGVIQAFGYAILNGDDEMAELGYINIVEITRLCGAELDLHFTPCTLAEIKAQRRASH